MFVFRGSIVSHFHFPGVLSVNGNITSIFIFRERISKKDVFFVCRLIWVLFIEGLKHSNNKYDTGQITVVLDGDASDHDESLVTFIPAMSFRLKLSVY